MTYPKHLYKSPGPHRRQGRTFEYIGCTSPEEEAELLSLGWHLTFEEAWGITTADSLIEQAEELAEAIDEMTPPTREELEQKASELGVSFNSRTKDETLVARIAEALD